MDKPTLEYIKIETVASNGHKSGLDPVAGTWTSRNGTVLHLNKINYFGMELITNDLRDKPKIPQVRVVYGGDKEGWESDPNDPAYLDELARWDRTTKYKSMLYVFYNGINIEIPSGFADSQREFFPTATATEMKYLYITSLIDVDEIDPLTNAILGRISPTEDGVAQSIARFPGTNP